MRTETMGIERIGVVGLGVVGRWVTDVLLQQGFPVCVYDERPDRVVAAVRKGAAAGMLPADVAEVADAVIMAVADERAAEEVLFDLGGIGETLRSGGLLIDATCSEPAFLEQAGARLAVFGISRMSLGDFLRSVARVAA